MKVLLTHLWPESNAGDYAIVRGTIDAIEAVSPVPVTFIGLTTFGTHSANLAKHFPETLRKGVTIKPALVPSYKNDECEQFSTVEKVGLSIRYILTACLLMMGAKRVARLFLSRDQRALLPEIEQADLVVVKGGAFLMGLPGVTGTLYLLRNALTVLWCAKLNGRCVIAPHSFGPFANKLQHWLLKVMLSGVKIYARERISLRLLQSLGLNVRYLPDMAFYLKPQSVLERNSLQIAVTARPCPTFLSPEKQRNYYEALTDAVVALVEAGYRIVFVPQVSGPDAREDDRQAIAAIRALAAERIRDTTALSVVDTVTLQDKFSAYAQSVCCVGTRMHSVIFSCLSGTKVVALAYLGPKHQGIMDELGLGEYVLSVTDLSPRALLSSIEAALSKQDASVTEARITNLRQLIEQEFSSLVRSCIAA
jgi:colanic acid/amylovoran biosynthesis protein